MILNPGRCASLDRAFRFLSYPESVKAKETPEKEDELDDPIDALGYGLVAALWSKPTVVSAKRPWREWRR